MAIQVHLNSVPPGYSIRGKGSYPHYSYIGLNMHTRGLHKHTSVQHSHSH